MRQAILKLGLLFFLILLILNPVLAYCNETRTITGNITQINKVCSKDNEVGGAPLIGMIFIPLVLALLLVIGSFHFVDPFHLAFKVFIYVLSIVLVYISTWYSFIILDKYYSLNPLRDAMGDTVFFASLMFFSIIVYFLVYFAIRLWEYIVNKGKKEMSY